MKMHFLKIIFIFTLAPLTTFAELNLGSWYNQALTQPNPELAARNSINKDIEKIRLKLAVGIEFQDFTDKEIQEMNQFAEQVFSIKSISASEQKFDLARLLVTRFNNDNRFLPAFTSIGALTASDGAGALQQFGDLVANNVSSQPHSTSPEITLAVFRQLVNIPELNHVMHTDTYYGIYHNITKLDSIPIDLITQIIETYKSSKGANRYLTAAAISFIRPTADWIPTYIDIFSTVNYDRLNSYIEEAYVTLSKSEVPDVLKQYVVQGLESEVQHHRRFAALAATKSNDQELLKQALEVVTKEISKVDKIIDANQPMGILESWMAPENPLRKNDKVSRSNAVQMETVAKGWFKDIQTKLNAQITSLKSCSQALN